MIIAIIPAKENSQGVKKKNRRKLNGKELVRYTLEAALASKYIDYVFITTDSPQIDGIAREYTSSTADSHVKTRALSRPIELTKSRVQVDEVVLFSLRQIQSLGYEPDTVVVLQPTSPFRDTEHIDEAIELYDLLSPAASDLINPPKTVVGVRESGYAYGVGGDELFPLGHKPPTRLGRQDSDYDAVCIENGSLYVVDAKKLSQERTFRASPFTPYYMDWISSFEIDTPLDWQIAEAVLCL